MDILPLLLKEFDQETQLTRRMLDRVPENNWDYKPHPKSMSLQNLVVHIAELPTWITLGLNTDGIDFATMDYKPTPVSSREALLQLHQKSVEQGRASLENAREEDLLPSWTMRTGDKVHAIMTRYEVIRHSFSQTIHHRAQLGVYLRLQDIALPGTYGPSADEPM